jgi:hypothetical protein
MPMGEKKLHFNTSHCFAVNPGLLQQESAIHSHGKKVIRDLEMRLFEILQRYLICAPNTVCVDDIELTFKII